MHTAWSTGGMKDGGVRLAAALVLLLSVTSGAYGAEGFPHRSADGCPVCHVSPPKSGYPADSADRRAASKLKAEPVALCVECHPQSLEKDHKVNVKTAKNALGLPLDGNGNIVCTTCHAMHPAAGSRHERGLLRALPEELCFSCHDK